MRPRILLIALTDWFGPARLPQALRAAGFDVGVLCDPAFLIAQSSHIDYRFQLSIPHIRLGLMEPVFRAIASFSPRLIVPCDEAAAILMQNLALAWDGARGPGGQRRVMVPPATRELLLRCLGDARSYPMRVNRALSRRAVAAFGVASPPTAPVPYMQVAEAFARDHGWPVVLTREERIGGEGERVCANADELRAAYSDFTRDIDAPTPLRETLRRVAWTALTGFHLAGDLTRPPQGGPLLTIEAQMPGRPASHSIVALEGLALAGLSAVGEVMHPAPFGPPSVVRLIEDPAMTDVSRKLIGRLGYTGFAGLDFTRDPATGKLWFLKFSPRPTPLAHLGALAGDDLCAALYQGLTGGFPAAHRPTRPTTIALFPQDWARDPDAADRHADHTDTPVEDDRLVQALRERMA